MTQYNVELSWDSTNLKTGKNTIFIVNFLNYKTNSLEKQLSILKLHISQLVSPLSM